MLFAHIILLSFIGITRPAMGYEAPLKENPFATALPDHFIVYLEAGCTFNKHLEHIDASANDLYFKNATNLVKDLQLYFGYFPHKVLDNIRSDVCVTSVSPDYLLTPAEHESREMSREEVLSHARLVKRQARIGWKRISQRYAPWNLIMMTIKDKKSLDAFEQPSRDSVYDYVEDPGKGVDVYALEADFDVSHPDFATRASVLPINGGTPISKLQKDFPARGHGTKCASISVGSTSGLAKSANLFFVYTRTFGEVLNALLKIKELHQQKIENDEQSQGWRGSVISLTQSVVVKERDVRLAAITQELDNLGVILVTTAGNQNKHFSIRNLETIGNSVYCISPGALCVGAVDRAYKKFINSNFGLPVNLWAPGDSVPVPVTSTTGEAGHSLMEGTSAAAPHVVGIAAIMLSFLGGHPDSGNAAIDSYSARLSLIGNAKRDFIQGLPLDSRNMLANTGIHSRNDDTLPFATYPHPKDAIEELLPKILKDFRDDLHSAGELSSRLLQQLGLSEKDQPTCLPDNDPDRIPLEDAEMLFLRLLWERGHFADYNNNGRPQPLVPCYRGACAYFRSEGQTALKDTGFSLSYMLHILIKCTEKRSDRTTTGGWMYSSLDRLHFGLRSKA